MVDDADYDWLNQWNWCAIPTDDVARFYAGRKEFRDGNWAGVRMHRLIIGFPPTRVDHRDGNSLNNQRENLRKATAVQNCVNAKKRSDNTSGYIGVSWSKRERKWLANMQVDKKMRYIGLFSFPEDAARARDLVAQQVYGEFAKLNF